MTILKGTNMTKFDTGGSGDYCIPDGYIKSVEKVWIDSYVVGAAGLSPTIGSILIGYLPRDKKLIEVEVFTPSLMAKATASSIHLSTTESDGFTAGDLGIMRSLKEDGVDDFSLIEMNHWVMLGSAFLTTSSTIAALPLYITVHCAGGESTIKEGTIRSIIKYT